MVTDQPAIAGRTQVSPAQQSWMQRRAQEIAMLPKSPQRPIERPPRAQEAAFPDGQPQSHRWIVATEVPVTSAVARLADFRGAFRLDEGVKVDALEVYCSSCRGAYGDVASAACEAAQSVTFGHKDHLLGGRPHERARRNTSEEADRTLIRDRQKKAQERAANREYQARSVDKDSAP
jgi:hypothetical protein